MRESVRQQIFNHYAELIRSGQLIEGDPLPTLASESERWGVSRITVSKTRKEMRTAGLIERGGPNSPARVAERRPW
ncbi:GntR family transcriptional regulator [Streptomyces sp. HNA39]|uniref:GntR family transcriptional regulator n=1 Tax=Streptomyces sp. HNA39 TaxID=2850561 RepID=UPI00200E35BE|nr:GntR family transcriptional regulator [Streptomyces sp. HNA39]UQA37504.1 GntR family transcriptional regulator [Streptomyces sp. HNA39]